MLDALETFSKSSGPNKLKFATELSAGIILGVSTASLEIGAATNVASKFSNKVRNKTTTVTEVNRSISNFSAKLGNRLERLGYDEFNTNRIMDSIQKGEQVVIVGENMKRVNAVARMVENSGGKSVT